MNRTNLKNKTVLITGGTSGLGLSIVKELIDKVQAIHVLARDINRLTLLKKNINSTKLKTYVCDIRDFLAIEKLVKKISKIDILINNAGVWLEGDFKSNDVEKIGEVIDTNLKGLIYTTRAVLPAMEMRKKGIILNIGSTSGLGPRNDHAVYVASKFGVRGFTDSLKLEFASSKIRVMGFYPGGINTPIFKNAGISKNINKYLKPSKVAKIIHWLLDQDDSYIIDHMVVNRFPKL